MVPPQPKSLPAHIDCQIGLTAKRARPRQGFPRCTNGATFAFVAWDQSTGTASTNTTRGTANPGAGGGTTAYSSQSATASLSVSSANDAPTLTDRGLSFDGTDVVVVASPPNLVMTSTLTFEAMVQRTGTLSGTQDGAS